MPLISNGFLHLIFYFCLQINGRILYENSGIRIQGTGQMLKKSTSIAGIFESTRRPCIQGSVKYEWFSKNKDILLHTGSKNFQLTNVDYKLLTVVSLIFRYSYRHCASIC